MFGADLVCHRQNFENKAECQTVSKAGDISRDGPDLMSDIEGLHPFMGEYKHVQGGVTWSETKLVI